MAKPLTSALPLTGNVVSRWYLEEVSGNRADAVGSNTLTDNNTVTSNADIPTSGFARSAEFTSANSEYLSITDASQSGLDPAASFSFSVFVKRKTNNVAQGIVGKLGSG
jgi:hypothetical protein